MRATIILFAHRPRPRSPRLAPASMYSYWKWLLFSYAYLIAVSSLLVPESVHVPRQNHRPRRSNSLPASQECDVDVQTWPRYLVEFRGLCPGFRIDELRDALSYVLRSRPVAARLAADIDFVVVDNEFDGQPLCGYIRLPSDAVAQEVSNRCSCLRSIIQVWGEGKTPEAVRDEVMAQFGEVVRPHFPLAATSAEREKNSWKIVFRRFGRSGRSGRDPEAKRLFLQTFNPILTALEGDVNLTAPSHQLVYLEDWHSFHSTAVNYSAAGNLEGLPEYTPLNRFFGKIVGFGREVQTDFSLNKRPFLGTTTLAPLPAHLCAAAAGIGPQSLVLDPFCGTGSILVSCAALGSKVVGSDIDADCLGLATVRSDLDVRPLRERDRSKNVKLNKNRQHASKRLGSPRLSASPDGAGLSTPDNMQFYGLQDYLVGLLARDVRDWLTPQDSYGPFDAIVTDPPYNRRERAMGSEDAEEAAVTGPGGGGTYGGCVEVIRTLCDVACARLVPGGSLVFWFPSDAFVSADHVRSQLLETLSEEARALLSLERLNCEILHDKLWRWLVVYTLRDKVLTKVVEEQL